MLLREALAKFGLDFVGAFFVAIFNTISYIVST
jgi:hypothetical protein